MTDRDEEIALLERQINDLEKRIKGHAEDGYDDLADDADDEDDEDDEDDYESLDDDDDDDDDRKEGRAPDVIAKAVDGPTKFSAMVDKTARELGCSKTEAARRVRQEYPDIANGYDELNKSYNSLVQAEIRKGCSEVVAKQRVAYAHPDATQAHIAKGDDAETAFMNMAAKLWKADPRLSRTEAMRAARLQSPSLAKKLQNA